MMEVGKMEVKVKITLKEGVEIELTQSEIKELADILNKLTGNEKVTHEWVWPWHYYHEPWSTPRWSISAETPELVGGNDLDTNTTVYCIDQN